MNNKGVNRTGQATQGLLKTSEVKQEYESVGIDLQKNGKTFRLPFCEITINMQNLVLRFQMFCTYMNGNCKKKK